MFDYMAAGRPILASDIPVFHEVLRDEIALFCESENPTSWIAAIRALQQDGLRRENMGASAKQEAHKYTWKNRARLTTSRLEKILE